MRIPIIFFLALSFLNAKTQNLLDNGGFEDINICTEYHAPCAPESWFNIKPANIPTVNRRLAPKALLGDQALLLPIYDVNHRIRPLVYTMLLCPLQKGRQYKLSFYLYTANRTFYNIDFAFLNKEPVTVDFDPYAVVPDFKIDQTNIVALVKGWTAVEHVFTATNDAKFLLLGNINSSPSMKYKQADGMNREGMIHYFIDEIVLRPMVPEPACKQRQSNLEKLHRQDLRHTEYVVVDAGSTDEPPQVFVDTLVLPSVLFRTNSAVIEKKFSGLLDTVIFQLSQRNLQSLEIIGHTDNRGKYENNLLLSQNRALAVKDYLLTKLAVENIITNGKADMQPIADNATDAGRTKNRRVEIFVTSLGKKE